MTSSQIIVLATPVFLLLIAVEYAWGRRMGRNHYRLDDAINSISLGMLSQISALFTRLLRVGIYTAVFASVAIWPHAEFWSTWTGWFAALVFYDFCYYWQHRLSHESAVLWASHVVHHQSQEFNLSTALRQTSSGVFLGWIFYLPMALAGVPPLVMGVVALVDLLYQYWVHTEQIGRLGWFDRWFCSPSNHRVHHAVNDRYLDKNYGGILIVWDRIFGSFRDEDASEPCIYGTRSALNSWDPLWSNAEVYWTLAQDSWHTAHWSDKLRVWFKAPGWHPADLAAHFPKPAFDIAQVQTFHPPMGRSVQAFSVLQFTALIVGVSALLWYAQELPLPLAGVWFSALTAALWALGALMQGRISVAETLLLESAAIATAASSADLMQLHFIFKPLTMLIAIFMVASCKGFAVTAEVAGSAGATSTGKVWLLAALAGSLAGDVFLMFEGFFIPGLVSFLLAHVAYILLLRRGVPWFPSRAALAATLGVGAAMYAFLWFGGLPAGLRIPVAAYVSVIALMVAQAIGRASTLRSTASWLVAAGAALFMVSDSLLATNKFVQPLPMAQFWVLGSYYAAQLLIVGGWLRGFDSGASNAADGDVLLPRETLHDPVQV